ncbi:MAG: hypothetical protein C3F13_09020 [Anaerolineales bacterium]|nr:hypothetical protein [Anaerolineae bacterium]PWB53543.1 MAG: hypothetical protein C3F13_09020 [Anaerolineales bacterium]
MDTYKSSFLRQRPAATGYLSFYGKESEKPPVTSTKIYKRPLPSNQMNNVMGGPDSLRVCIDYHGCFALENDIPAALRSINKSRLSSVVRRSLNRNNFQIQGWRTRNMDGKSANPVSAGLYRFEGVGVDRGEWLDWSVILKVIQSPANLGYSNYGEGNDPTHWNYWKRELLIYQSGWLDGLPEGVTAPRCYEAQEIPGNIAGMWLEDVSDTYSGNWPLARYAMAARHLGRFNGIYISRRQLPTFPWLSRHRTRQWLSFIPWQDFPWDHPQVWQVYPNPELDSFRSLLNDHDRFLAKLEQLPKTISHGDTNPVNFISRHSPRKLDQTVAMDWSLTGIEALGDDLGQLVYGTYLNLRNYRLHDISETLFTSYVNGLQDSGCRIDSQLVRFGYVVSAAYRVGLSRLLHLTEQINRNSDFMGQSMYPSVIPQPFESVMADEAYRLLDRI